MMDNKDHTNSFKQFGEAVGIYAKTKYVNSLKEIEKILDSLSHEDKVQYIENYAKRTELQKLFTNYLQVQAIDYESTEANQVFQSWLKIQREYLKNISINQSHTNNDDLWEGNTDELKDVIYPDFVYQFSQIEKGLHERPSEKPYLKDFNWQGNKTELCKFLVTIIDLGWTKKGKNSDTKTRRFFEKRYGFDEKALSDLFKRSKRPKLSTATILFHFIDAPVER